MNTQWKDFISADFWFTIDRSGLYTVDWVIGGLGAVLIIASITFWLYSWKIQSRVPKSRFQQLGNILFLAGLAEVVWLGLRYQQASALGTRFAAVVAGLVILAWLYGPIIYFMKQYKNDIVAEQKRIEKEKYLKM